MMISVAEDGEEMAFEWVTKQQVIDLLHYNSDELCSAVIEDVEKLCARDVVPRGAYYQVAWERDLAIEQLRSYGVELSEEADVQSVVRCEDCRYYNAYVGYPMGDCMYWVMEEDLPIKLPVYGNDFCSRGDGI